jgi:hypothetical protein
VDGSGRGREREDHNYLTLGLASPQLTTTTNYALQKR